MSINDNGIIDTLKESPERGFRMLMMKYQEPLYWHIRRLVVSHDDAQDAAQETFVRIYRSFDQYRGDCSFRSWIYRIATNECLNFLTRRREMLSMDDEEVQQTLLNQLDDDPWFDGDQAERALQQALLTLPEKQRLVFNLRYFDEMDYAQMSEVLHTSVGALKASYHHAVKKIESYVTEIASLD